jgi:hypothetical protein
MINHLGQHVRPAVVTLRACSSSRDPADGAVGFLRRDERVADGVVGSCAAVNNRGDTATHEQHRALERMAGSGLGASRRAARRARRFPRPRQSSIAHGRSIS